MIERGPWIAVDGGFLCDSGPGEVVVRNEVAYWHSVTSDVDYVLDLTPNALAEARRRNELPRRFDRSSTT